MQIAKLLGNSPLVTNFVYSYGFINPVFTQSIRFHKRKPIWLPTAKTKVFRVPKKPKIPEDEFSEIQRLYTNYKTYLRSTLAYFKETYEKNQVQLDPAVIEKAEHEDFVICSQRNDEWNKQIAAEREERLAKARERKELNIMRHIERVDKIKERQLEQVEKSMQKLKSIAPTFITRQNIDQAIEDALANTVNYNKAIHLNGEWYTEPTGVPPPSPSVLNAAKEPKAAAVKQ